MEKQKCKKKHAQYEHYVEGMPVNDFGMPAFLACAPAALDCKLRP